jgi:archaellum component FlaG (FlaF/FlaG flagellin family)
LDFVRIVRKDAERRKKQMKANPLMRVLAAKAAMFVGLALIVAVVVGIMTVAFVDTPSAAPQLKTFGAQKIIDQNGTAGFPITGNYTSKGGTLIFHVSGSGWSGAANNKIGMSVLVDGAKVGQVWSYTNEANSHKAFVPGAFVVKNKPADTVNIELDNAGFPNTNIDPNDNFKVTVVEIPQG